MVRKANVNAWISTALAAGLTFVAAGAFVPSEEAVLIGFLLSLAAMAGLIGINWPKTPASNLVSLDAFRAGRRPGT